MSRKKLILSILLMISMIVAGIVLPALWKAEKQKNHTADPKQPAKEIQTEGEDTASLPTLKYVAFEELQAFFADTQINELKQQFSLYLKEAGKTDITSVTFLPEQTTYPEGNDIMLTFAFSDNTTLPVTCSTSKIQQRLGQQIRINRSKIKDASDTNADFDDLDSAIRSGYFLKAGLANNEDFYYINLLITITASDLEELQWRIQEMKKLLISQDMDLHSCYFLQEQGFLSSLPLANLDKKLYELSKRNVLTTGAASCYPFTSYSICDDNGILFGVNKHNNSLVIADIFDSKQYKKSFATTMYRCALQGKEGG